MSRTVLIAHDHPLTRSAFRGIVENTYPEAVVLEAGDGAEGIRLAERESPQIALMDIGLPRLGGLETARQVRDVSPFCRIIMVSMHHDEHEVIFAMLAGARGYLLKDAAATELAPAMESVLRGDVYVSRGIRESLTPSPTGPRSASDRLARLSPRQREILQLIAEGQSTKEIAFRLGSSTKTVETHRRLLMRRLDIYDVASLTRFAVLAGLVSAEA